MARNRTPRERWVEAGLATLASGGPDAVRVEALARDLAVTKGGFYWHFADRAALLDAVLEAWERHSIDEVIEEVEGGDGDPRERLRSLFRLGASADDLRRADLAIRLWARDDPNVARRVRRVDSRRLDYLRSLFTEITPDPAEVEARCLMTMSLFVASPLLAPDPPALQRVFDRLEA